MNHETHKQLEQKLIEEFDNRYKNAFTDAEVVQIKTLLNLYYQYIPISELEMENPSDLMGAIIAHWQLLRNRTDTTPMIRVYNPNFEEHGWQSPHTIVEIIADDIFFLVDSISMGLNRTGLTIHLTIHPVVQTVRNKTGALLEINEPTAEDGKRESLIRFQVEKQLSSEVMQALEIMIRSVIKDVGLANQDWLAMQEKVQSIGDGQENLKLLKRKEIDEANSFLKWIVDNHFTFLSYCEFDLVNETGKERLELDKSSLLGLITAPSDSEHSAEAIIPVLGDQYKKFSGYLVVTKANARSRVHRPAYLDFIGVKRYNAKGEVDGLYCIVGLFASAAYSSPTRDIPLLRKKVREVSRSAGLSLHSHSARALNNLLDTFPRDTLFQVTAPEMRDIALGILGLQERQRTRLFISKDSFDRFYSCLIYLPRERYNRELRIRIQKTLVEAFCGTEVEFSTQFSESILARVHYIIHCPQGQEINFDHDALEQKIIATSQTWQDGLLEALDELYGEAKAAEYFRAYSQAFPGGFREDFYPRTAATDIARLEQSRINNELGLHFYRPILESNERVHFRLYSMARPIPLSDAIPILEDMGLSVHGERPYQIRHGDGHFWIHDFSMRYAKGADRLTDESSELFQEAFLKVWNGEADSDGFNQLVLDAGLSWRKIVLIRAYSRYLKQIKLPYSQAYIIESLTLHADITSLLVKLFYLKFDPESNNDPLKQDAVLNRIESLLESVSSLDHDRIIRCFINLIQSTLRTNYFQPDKSGEDKTYISFKIDSSKVNGMPLPRPMFEIFVFSTRMEGVHLRGGKVARGGLRWSDRMEDYRTEVLGLMKAQMIKNTVIVPVGSKGGFIVKRMPIKESREKSLEEVTFCYKTLLRGMLDITDNLVGGEVIPPENVIRQDEDDPYLVIAADKGTATFSDLANSVADEYGFWLGDAFASGGSAGYDHKKMGITAKGAWESVKRNFRELGTDIQTTDFRVVGIGDMAGDVFGNGMLLSRHIKLVAAFNHMHIFIDPDPDPEASYSERERLFNLPRSSWGDYNKDLISKGGGIFSRSAKSISLNSEIKSLLGVKADRLTPNEVINLLLKAQIDLLWNGGIGTYIKSEHEANDQVWDKANDGVRVNGNDLRCKVVGEGGNLGATQLGRVEYAAKGGLIHTDAIDNSAGVDCSDHEVNIKILLGQIVANGDMTRKQRDKLLVEMTDDISRLVLADNYSQTQAISMVASSAPQKLYEHARFIDFLEQKGMLNRELEFLPSKKEIIDRQAAKGGLLKPEISILLSYSKMTYYEALINSDIPDDEYLHSELMNYFPKVLSDRYADQILDHRLRREIISTYLTNSIVDHIGPGFGFRVREEVGSNIAGVTRAYLSARRIFSTDQIWEEIQDQDNKVVASVQIELMQQLTTLLERAVIWILQHRRNNVVIKDLVAYFQQGVEELIIAMPNPLAAKDRLALNNQIKHFVKAGVPRDLAQKISAMIPLSSALDIVEVANQGHKDIPLVGSLYYNLGTSMEFRWLRRQINLLGGHTHWHHLAKTRLIDTLNSYQRELTAQVLKSTKPYKSARKRIGQWAETNQFAVDRHLQMISELKSRSEIDFAMLSVCVSGVSGLLVSEI